MDINLGKRGTIPSYSSLNSRRDPLLITELQAVFHRLARNGYHTRAAAGNGILITASWILCSSNCTDANSHLLLREKATRTLTRALLRVVYMTADIAPKPCRGFMPLLTVTQTA